MASHVLEVKSHKRYLVILVLVAVGIYFVIPHFGELHTSWQLIGHAKLYWLSWALIFTFTTYLLAAANYYFLAFKPLHYSQLVLVQLAAMFVNKLLPAGIGGLSANYAYLRRRGHGVAQSASTLAANDLIGVLGHVMVSLVTLLVFSGHISQARSWSQVSVGQVVAIGATVLLILLALLWLARERRPLNIIKNTLKKLLSYRRRPERLLAALISSIGLTLCNLLCLYSCSLSLGQHLTFVSVLIVFSLGMGLGEVSPTPGGLGGVEAGLFGGLVASHVTAPHALAIALLYRLVSYWLPMLGGSVAFIVCQKRKLLMT